MSEDQDPLIKDLFAGTQEDLDGDTFTAAVVDRARFARYRAIAPWILGVVVLVASVWFFAVPLELAQLIVASLSATLVDLGDGWLAWVLSPINSIAALLALAVKVIRICHKKIIAATYAN